MKQLIRELLAEKLELHVPEGAELLKAREVARYFRVSYDVLGDWRRNGEGPPFLRLSRQVVRYPRGALLRYMRQHLRGGILQKARLTGQAARTGG